MERRMNVTNLAAIAIAALIQSSAAQTNHVVGDSVGWTIPYSASYYSSWAASKTFHVGHILVFNFANHVHDVAQVTKAEYDACITTNPILLVTTSPARIVLNATGEYYFTCNFTGHCAVGQKFMVNVSAATSSTPASQPPPSSSPALQPSPRPSPSSPPPAPQPTTPTPVSAPSPAPVSATRPSPTATPPGTSPTPASSTTPSVSAPPPPGSSASSLGVAGISATFLSIFVALLY